MARIELDYIEIDGLLYPNIETGMEHIEDDLGKLAQHCKAIDQTAFEQSEQIQAAWLKTNPMPIEDALERIRLRTQAQMIADEIVTAEFNLHLNAATP